METTLHQIEKEVRKEIDYANAIDELETIIQYAIEQSLLRRDGESIQYVWTACMEQISSSGNARH